MPTIVGIFIFISRINLIKFQLSWAWKEFYNLGAWFYTLGSTCQSQVNTLIIICCGTGHI